MRFLAASFAVLILGACAASPMAPEIYLEKKGVNIVTPEHFQHCHAYGCKRVADIELSKKDWRAVEQTFKPRAKNAEQERAQLANAIGKLEELVGNYTGMPNDHWGTFQKTGYDQHDCVDESVNSTVYLSVLKAKGLMRFHEVLSPQSRVLLGRWPHQTAVIKETDSNAKFAVDSWFHDNGFAAEIIDLATWKNGWKPEEHLTHKETKSSDLDDKS